MTQSLRAKNYQDQVESFERATPNAQQLSAGETEGTLQIIRNMNEWQSHIETVDLEPAERAQLSQRVEVARRRYRLAAAEHLPDPRQSYGLLLPEFSSWQPAAEVVEAARRYAEGVAEMRRKQHQSEGTYRDSVPRANADEQVLLGPRDTIGNCVFGSQPFGSEGEPNPSLAFAFSGDLDTQVHVRCYTDVDLATLPQGGRLVATVPRLGEEWYRDLGGSEHFEAGTRHMDFVLGYQNKHFMPEHDSPAHVDVRLQYIWADDNVVVLDASGKLRVRPDWKRRTLARSGFLWEPKPR